MPAAPLQGRRAQHMVLAPPARAAAPTNAPPQEPRLKKPSPIILNNQVLHSITDERLDIVHSLSDHVTQNVSGGGGGGQAGRGALAVRDCQLLGRCSVDPGAAGALELSMLA